ncbi:twin-arginine translocation signal domain-containing protein [Frondihabitans sucicola]|uniref:twin-arginine translocation signal domain-containing protein n=1 Tax=Frondihabitans sucicola TaxID=1268041 RepID=UPI0025737BD4|nr:twin-arginine translocation signal domain-containing protein [Frondihabitans sucicola]
MFEDKFITSAIARSAEKGVDRRKLLGMVGLAGAGVAAASSRPPLPPWRLRHHLRATRRS